MALEFEEMSRNAEEVQTRVLRKILRENATCEYLRACGVGEDVASMKDAEMVKRFKEKVPVASYSHFQPFIQRVLDGDTSPILTCAPIRTICLSSGTSKGSEKYIPYSDGLKTGTIEVARISTSFRDRIFPITPGARILEFNFNSKVITTKGGLRVGTATTHLSCDNIFKMRQQRSRLTSCCPDEVILTDNFEQGMYCHLLCGLMYAAEVEVVSAIFGFALAEALRTLEAKWQDLCHDIKVGHLHNNIVDPSLRVAIMSKVLTHPNPEVANKLIATFTIASINSSWKGIIKKLWPRCQYVLSIITGTMEMYVETLQHYMGDRLPLVGADYGATEGWVAANIDPCAHPNQVSFTVVPSLSYFEFIPISKKNFDECGNSISSLSSFDSNSHVRCHHAFKETKPINLTEVKVGQEYEIVMTTSGGLYRYQLGDILRVTGFYNNTPQFAYVGRKDVILSINVDKITEADLGLVVRKVSQLLQERSTMKLVDYTSYAEIKNISKNYVFFWEVEGGQVDTLENEKVLGDCATCMDAAFVEFGYVTSRKMNTIGALQLCVVKSGTFKKLLQSFMNRAGASITQYKTPRCIPASSTNMLSILQENTIAKFFSSHTF